MLDCISSVYKELSVYQPDTNHTNALFLTVHMHNTQMHNYHSIPLAVHVHARSNNFNEGVWCCLNINSLQ